MFDGPIKITISDPDTGKELESRVVENDYVLICAGNRYLMGTQVMGRLGRATHILRIGVDQSYRPQKAES